MKRNWFLTLCILVSLIVICGCQSKESKDTLEDIKSIDNVNSVEDREEANNSEELVDEKQIISDNKKPVEKESQKENKQESKNENNKEEIKIDDKKESSKTDNKVEIKEEAKTEVDESIKTDSKKDENKKEESKKEENIDSSIKEEEPKKDVSNTDTSKKEETNLNDNKNEKIDEKVEEEVKDDSSVNNTEIEQDEVDILRNSIQDLYGVTIKYGDEIGNYRPKGVTPIRMTDRDEIKTYLNYTKNELAKYPNGFFKEMKNYGMPLTIYLISGVPSNVFAGFTDREFMSNIKITVVKGYDFSYTLNHEIMHYIDAYLECKMYPESPYTEYIALNPSGFSYGSFIDRYNFGYNGSDKEVYFMDSYAQTNVREDRAQVFRQMISRAYKLTGMFDQGSVLQSKALIIDKQIRQYYDCAKGTLTWDKFIK